MPEHSLTTQVFKSLDDHLILEVSPTLGTGLARDPANTVFTGGFLQVDALVHWFPLPSSRLSVGYQNILSNRNAPGQPGWVTNAFFSF